MNNTCILLDILVYGIARYIFELCLFSTSSQHKSQYEQQVLNNCSISCAFLKKWEKRVLYIWIIRCIITVFVSDRWLYFFPLNLFKFLLVLDNLTGL